MAVPVPVDRHCFTLACYDVPVDRYCFAMACYEVATQEALSSAEDELLAIIHKTKRPMPAAFYLLGRVYMRLNRCDFLLASLRAARHAVAVQRDLQ